MQTAHCYETYPLWIPLVANGLSLAIYLLGVLIAAHGGALPAGVYVVYCLWMEWRLLRKSCAECYYYGKRCAFGKGIVCAWILSPGDPQNRPKPEITWRLFLPDLLVLIIPMVLGLIFLFRDFSWTLLAMMAGMLLLAFPANGYVRENLACPFCKKRETGCAAVEFFEKMRKEKNPPQANGGQ
ncbi:MAG: hypothetical protein ACE15F_22540 [bacterium]